MSSTKTEVDAEVDVTDAAGKKFQGTFVLRTSLSAREESEVGRRRRAALGPMPIATDADTMDYLCAEWQAQLNVRAVKVPDFWRGGGDEVPRSVVIASGKAMDAELALHGGGLVKDEAEARRQIRETNKPADAK